jgi:hypothetical protein
MHLLVVIGLLDTFISCNWVNLWHFQVTFSSPRILDNEKQKQATSEKSKPPFLILSRIACPLKCKQKPSCGRCVGDITTSDSLQLGPKGGQTFLFCFEIWSNPLVLPSRQRRAQQGKPRTNLSLNTKQEEQTCNCMIPNKIMYSM